MRLMRRWDQIRCPFRKSPPAERTGGQEILELGVLAASLPGLLLAAWIRGRKK